MKMSLFLGERLPFKKSPVHVLALVFISTGQIVFSFTSHKTTEVAEELFQIYI